MNWPFVLVTGVLNLYNAIIKVEGEQSEQEVREAALALYNSIPSAWVRADKQFADDLKKCLDVVKVDNRKEWCGKKVGPPNIVTEERLNPWKLYHTCVDVFYRRNLLNKPKFRELMTGRRFKRHDGKKKKDR